MNGEKAPLLRQDCKVVIILKCQRSDSSNKLDSRTLKWSILTNKIHLIKATNKGVL